MQRKREAVNEYRTRTLRSQVWCVTSIL